MDAVYIALVAAGMGVMWWRHLRPVRTRAALGSAYEPDAEVALHVAVHESQTRHQALSSLHILYGLLQDEQLTGLMRELEADVDALEDRVLAALDALPRSEIPEAEEAVQVYGRAAAHAHHAERRATCVDLWAYLRSAEAGTLLEAAGVDQLRVLFRSIHGGNDPDATPAGAGDVHVVLRNDDYSTQEFVCEILEDVFALPQTEARVRMLATHVEGRAVIGRFTAADARAKIDEVRSRARARGFPLWIGAEPT